jgi:hypothetical protein
MISRVLEPKLTRRAAVSAIGRVSLLLSLALEGSLIPSAEAEAKGGGGWGR